MTAESQRYIGSGEREIEHHCGVFAVRAPGHDVVTIAQSALYDYQHRGHEGAGIVASNGFERIGHKDNGWVKNVFDKDAIQKLQSINPVVAIGQDRYSTQGSETNRNALQPFDSDGFIMAHNGTFSNGRVISQLLSEMGFGGEVYSDSYAAYQLISSIEGDSLEEKISEAIPFFDSSYSMVMSQEDKLYAVRDYRGVRPLSIGKLPDDSGYVVGSETNAFGNIGAEFIRDVEPGEAIVIDDEGIRTFFKDGRANVEDVRNCSFEYVYIAAPDSRMDGRYVAEIRHDIGTQMAKQDKEKGFEPEVVVPVQQSGIAYAIAYAEEMGIPLRLGLIANGYMGRVFTEPDSRDVAARRKHRGSSFGTSGKRAVIIDDSVVRGDTMSQFENALSKHPALAGFEKPREIHLRSCFPKIVDLCYMGVDMAGSRDELIAYNQEGKVTDIAQLKHLDSVDYIEPSALIEAIRGDEYVHAENATDAQRFAINRLCGGCMTGEHPVPTDASFGKTRDRLQVNMPVEAASGIDVRV